MKKVLSLIALMAIGANATDYKCASDLIEDYRLVETVQTMDVEEKMDQAKVDVWKKYFDYDLDQFCINDMTVARYKTADGRELLTYYTNSDECDGGNVYGLITDLENNPVIEISDSQLYCPGLYSYGK